MTESANADDVSAFVDRFVGKHRLRVLSRDALAKAEFRRASFPDFSLSYLRYGREVEVHAQDPDYYHLQVGLNGSCQVTQKTNLYQIGGRAGLIINPSGDLRLRYTDDCEKIILRVERDALNEYVSSRLGFTLQRPLLFQPSINLGSYEGESFVRFLDYVIREIGDPRSRFANDASCGCLKDMMFDSLITLMPNNYSEMLKMSEGSGGSAVVNYAIDYMCMNLDKNITPQELALATKVSVRSLYADFHKHAGVSPIAYLRSLRLRKAREMLSDPEQEGMGVTEVAYAVGIEHLGRFARDYQRLFGEKPSETVKSRRIL